MGVPAWNRVKLLLKVGMFGFLFTSGEAIKCFSCSASVGDQSGCDNLDKENPDNFCEGKACYKHIPDVSAGTVVKKGCISESQTPVRFSCETNSTPLPGDVTIKTIDCYCNNDFCNSAISKRKMSKPFIILASALSIITTKIVSKILVDS